MTHRINDLALFHSGNSFVIPRKLLPVSLRFGYNSTTSTTASAVVCFQPCRTSFRRVATADRTGRLYP